MKPGLFTGQADFTGSGWGQAVDPQRPVNFRPVNFRACGSVPRNDRSDLEVAMVRPAGRVMTREHPCFFKLQTHETYIYFVRQ